MLTWPALLEQYMASCISSVGSNVLQSNKVCYSRYCLLWKMNACRQEDSVTPFLFGSRTVVGKHRGDDFLQGRSLCLPFEWTPFHVLLVVKGHQGAVSGGAVAFILQRNCSLYCTLTARSTTVTCFTFLPLPFIHQLHACTLPLSR